MKLTTKAKDTLNRRVRLDLAFALGFTETWINKLVDANKDNGPLTTTKSLQVIQEATGLTVSEILEETEQERAIA